MKILDPITQYFSKINCEFLHTANLNQQEQAVYLQKLYQQHTENFPFHNFELRSVSQLHPLFRTPLTLFKMNDFLKGYHGGFCFQNTMILYAALKSAGFSVFCTIAKMLNGLLPDSNSEKRIPATHLILVVDINDRRYLLDPSLAMTGHASPFLISPMDQKYEQKNHPFKIETHNGKLVLYRQEGESCSTVFYSFLKPANLELIRFQLAKLQYFPDILGIRDLIILVGIATPTGGQSLLWHPKNKHFILKTIKSQEEDKQQIITDVDKAYRLLQTHFKINHISKTEFEHSLRENPRIKPKRSLEIDFPIDEQEISKLRSCF